MNSAFRNIAWCLVALVSFPSGTVQAETVRRALCTQADAARELELRTVAGVEDVCDVVHRRTGEGSEERTLHPAAARSDFCAARFEGLVRSLRDAGWRCSVEGRALEGRAPSPPASALPNDVGPFARVWRTACSTAHAEKRVDAERLCDCAVQVMSEAGFEERDFEVLASPYTDAGAERPVHRAGLLYGVGMMAVDALARCDAS